MVIKLVFFMSVFYSILVQAGKPLVEEIAKKAVSWGRPFDKIKYKGPWPPVNKVSNIAKKIDLDQIKKWTDAQLNPVLLFVKKDCEMCK